MTEAATTERYVCAGEGDRVFTVLRVEGDTALLAREEDGKVHGWEERRKLTPVAVHIAAILAEANRRADRLR